MPTQPKVSVIVPVHGTAWSLRQCLDSLFGQSLRDIEIIVVNDASPDDAATIIDEYARWEPRIRSVTNAVNCNLFESRLRGIESAGGEYIAFCDSDDAMPPQALECLYTAAVRGGTDAESADIVHGRTRALRGAWAGARPGTGGILYNYEPFRVATGEEFVAAMLNNIRGWNVWGKLFRRELVRSCLVSFPRDTGWFQGEDMAFCVAFGFEAERYVGVEDVVYAYRYSDLRSVRDEDSAVSGKRVRDQLQILAFVKEAIERAPRGSELREPFPRMSRHVAAAVLETIPAASRQQFSEELAQLGLEPMSVRRGNILSLRYHCDWIRRNGMREYRIRLRILLANACRAVLGWF